MVYFVKTGIFILFFLTNDFNLALVKLWYFFLPSGAWKNILLPTGLAVVDCSASSETVEILMQAMDLGCCVVLANKKPLTCKIVGSLFLMLPMLDCYLENLFISFVMLIIFTFCANCIKTSLLNMQDEYEKLISKFRHIRYESTVCFYSLLY